MDNSYDARTERRRILLNNDMSASFSATCSPAARTALEVQRGIESYVDELAAAKIDATATCLFSGYRTLFPCSVPGTEDRLRTPVQEQKSVSSEAMVAFQSRLRPLIEEGGDPVAIQLRRCQELGIEYLACLRMNDRHPGGGPFKMQREDLHLEDLQHLGEYRRGFDFTHEIVRENLLGIAADILRRYDVDGLELDWVRWCRVFPMAVATHRAPLLTDFTASVRALLDEAAARRGRDRLTLSVRVPQTLEECRKLGFDLEAWMKTAALDCICPSDFLFTDYGTPVEDFAALAKGSKCRVYPSVHPVFAWGDDERLMTAENYQALAKSFYHRGADGISAYNYQFHWREDAEMWPKALSFLTAIRFAGTLEGPRHYLFHALWDGNTSPTDEAHDHDIRLDRSEAQPSGVFRFYVHESSGMLLFKAIGLDEGEALSVAINKHVVSGSQIATEIRSEGQSAKDGHPWGPFMIHRVRLATPPLQDKENELKIALTAARRESGTVEIREVEFVAPGPG